MVGKKDPLESLIVGDHLEAIAWITEQTDDRAGKTDLKRMRGIVR